MSVFKDHFRDILSSAYTVNMYKIFNSDVIEEVQVKTIVLPGEDDYEVPEEFYGAKLNREKSKDSGPWHERLPNHEDPLPKYGEGYGQEYFIPLRHAYDALESISLLTDHMNKCLEIRTIASDHLWLSPCYHRQSLAITFGAKKTTKNPEAIFRHIEEKLAPFDARPHWGKCFAMTPETIKVCTRN